MVLGIVWITWLYFDHSIFAHGLEASLASILEMGHLWTIWLVLVMAGSEKKKNPGVDQRTLGHYELLIAAGRCSCNLELVIFKLKSSKKESIGILSISCEIVFRWMPHHLADD